jgi:GNAT superfamily N-acetyltransferase
MISIQYYQPENLHGLQALINSHLRLIVDEWSLPGGYIATSLSSDPLQVLLNQWVTERVTLCASKNDQVVAAAHLLRYSTGSSVSTDYQNAGDIGWFLFLPKEIDAAKKLFDQCQTQFARWGVSKSYIWDFNLPVPVFLGLPDAWPHITDFLVSMHCKPSTSLNEAIFGGWIKQDIVEHQPPIEELHVEIKHAEPEAQISALVGSSLVGKCSFQDDLTLGGALPAFDSWAALSAIEISKPWRDKGIGTWLIQLMIHRLSTQRKKITFSVTHDDEVAGAGRFYARFGWGVLARSTKGWILE